MARDAKFEEFGKLVSEEMTKNLTRYNTLPAEQIYQAQAAKDAMAQPITMEELEKIAAGETSTEEEEKPAANPSVVTPPAGPVNVLKKKKRGRT